MKPSEKIAQLGITLPIPAAPIGSYIPGKVSGKYVYTSGQLPFVNGTLTHTGKVPADVSVEEAAKASRTAMINAVAAAAQAAGGVDNILQVVRVGVFVNSSPGFFEQPTVGNGGSDLLVEIFGDAGRHARAAVGVAELPRNAAVEIELLVELL